MDDPNITMEEYIRLEEEKARRHSIVFNDALTSEVMLSCEPMVSPLNDNKIDLRIPFDESDDEDYIPTVSYFDDLDFFKDFENEFPAIVYNDALMSKLDFLTEPTDLAVRKSTIWYTLKKTCAELVMAALIISISLDLSQESVGSHAILRLEVLNHSGDPSNKVLLLFGVLIRVHLGVILLHLVSAIPVIISLIPEVPAEVPIVPVDSFVGSEVGVVLSDFDPSKDLMCLITPPTTQTDTTVIPVETPIIEPTIPPSPDYTPASPDYSPATDLEYDPSDDQSSDHHYQLPHHFYHRMMTPQTYLYHLNGPVHIMTVRKRVGPLPTYRLAVRHSVNHSSLDSSSKASSDFHSDASSDSSLRHLLPDHSSPDLLSTSAGPSRKRHRSLMTFVPALPLVSGALSPVRADLIPSPKRIRSPETATDLEGCSEDSFEPYIHREVGLGVDVKDESSEQSRFRGTDIEVDDDVERSDRIDIDPIEAVIKACFDFVDIIRASRVDVRVEDVTIAWDAIEMGMRDLIVVSDDGDTPHVVSEVTPEPAQEGATGSTYETLGDLIQRFHDHTEAIPIYRVHVIEGVQREQGHRIVGVKSTVTALTERVTELERDNRRLRDTASVESQRVD
ncbi:hypothetical protein Tco_0487977 [Tanacetum coccineum]